jgi:phosphonate transport system permease protein
LAVTVSGLRLRAFPPNWGARTAFVALAVYAAYAFAQLDITAGRLAVGMGEAGRFLGRMWPPNFTRWELLLDGLLESLQIAVIASALGIFLALPLGLMAARNLAPWPLAMVTRGFIAFCRSLHYVIVAILFVKAIGFGALAGVAALTIASMGFIAKLFAEAAGGVTLRWVFALSIGFQFAQFHLGRHCRRGRHWRYTLRRLQAL